MPEGRGRVIGCLEARKLLYGAVVKRFFEPLRWETGSGGEGKESKPYKKGYAVTLRCGFGRVETPGGVGQSFNASLTPFGMAGVGR